MKKEIKHSDKRISTGAYSAGILTDGWLLIGGQGPLNLATGEVVPGSVDERTLLTLSHIKKIVEAANGKIDNVFKCTVLPSDINDFDKYDAMYCSFFSRIKPARTKVQSVLSDGTKVWIDAIARIS